MIHWFLGIFMKNYSSTQTKSLVLGTEFQAMSLWAIQQVQELRDEVQDLRSAFETFLQVPWHLANELQRIVCFFISTP